VTRNDTGKVLPKNNESRLSFVGKCGQEQFITYHKKLYTGHHSQCQRNEESQSMFEIQFILGIFDFTKYPLQFFFFNLHLGNHLFTPKHTTYLAFLPLSHFKNFNGLYYASGFSSMTEVITVQLY